MIVWTAVWLELPLQLSLTKDQLAEHMFFSTGFKLNLWFTLKATRAGVITTNVEYKRLFFSLFPLDVGSTGMKSATIRQHFSISMCKGCHVLCFQGRAQTTANIGMGYDTHARTDTCAHTYTHTQSDRAAREGCTKLLRSEQQRLEERFVPLFSTLTRTLMLSANILLNWAFNTTHYWLIRVHLHTLTLSVVV